MGTGFGGPASLVAWISRRRPQLRLSLRITIAALASFALGEVLGLAQSYWAVFTAIIVMQASVGGSIKATVDRFVGTVGGSLWGVVVSLAIPHGDSVSMGLALLAVLAPLALVSALYPAYRVAPITAVILLLSPTSHAAGPFASALNRIFEIGIGSVVALLVALLVLPARAHSVMAAAACRALEAMAELSLLLTRDVREPVDGNAVQALHDRIRRAIAAAEAAAGESNSERRSRLTEAPDPEPLCRTLRRLRNDLVMVGRATALPFPEPVGGLLAEHATTAGTEIAAFLREIGPAIAKHAQPPPVARVEQALAGYADQIGELRRDGMTKPLTDELVGRIFGLALGMDQLRQNLEDLVDRAADLAGPAPPI